MCSQMYDAHSASGGGDMASASARAHVHPQTPSLRRKRGSEDMSSLHLASASPYQVPATAESSSLAFADHTAHSGAGRSPSVPSSGLLSALGTTETKLDEQSTEPTTALSFETRADSSSLKPLLPSSFHDAVDLETLSTRLFSVDHLDVILRDCALTRKFTRFVDEYRPQHVQALQKYTEAKKAIAAVRYANAIANQVVGTSDPPLLAANLDERFYKISKDAVESLVEDALPAYLTSRLVSVVSDSLVREITQTSTPLMRELVPSLAEVYCITDPSMPDNPIVYASEEFFTLTQYAREEVIGRNCRFLQGPKSSRASVRRLVAALQKGEEICETILNYTKDGTPFMNLLMLAPMLDAEGEIRYYLGCQINVSSSVRGGRGIESFAQLLRQERVHGSDVASSEPKFELALQDLGQLLTDDEAEIITNRSFRSIISRSREIVRPPELPSISPGSRPRNARVVLDALKPGEAFPVHLQPTLNSSVRLPVVYQNYLLVRPYPSLRITFTSPSLRVPSILQTRLLDQIAAQPSVREELLRALSGGSAGVTAHISWLTSLFGKEGDTWIPKWIHCTPLFAGDGRIGVWMVLVVDDEVAAKDEVRRTVAAGPRASCGPFERH